MAAFDLSEPLRCLVAVAGAAAVATVEVVAVEVAAADVAVEIRSNNWRWWCIYRGVCVCVVCVCVVCVAQAILSSNVARALVWVRPGLPGLLPHYLALTRSD